jgi:hypothetical protein
MSDYTTINGHRVKTHEHRDHKIPQHARRLAARLDRAHPAVERIDYNISTVSVWMEDDHKREAFTIPDGWHVVMVGVFGGGVCIDLERDEEGDA